LQSEMSMLAKGIVAAALVAATVVVAEARRQPATVNARLLEHVGTGRGYREVKAEVLEWHGTTRNGCVAFVSTALRQIGVDVPQDEKRDGYGISRWTSSFSSYLVDDLGWVRIDDMALLEPGDVVFTEGDVPWHVMVFAEWHREKARVGVVIDNQGFRKRREFVRDPDGSSDVSGFQYALRAPAL
jgi:hypothetical protein